MAKKKDKPQVINNIQELNLEIDYDKLAEAIVKAQNKNEVVKNNYESEHIGYWKAIWNIIRNKKGTQEDFMAGLMCALMTVVFNILAIFLFVCAAICTYFAFDNIRNAVFSQDALIVTIIKILKFTAYASSCFTFLALAILMRGIANDIYRQRNKNYIVAVFSGMTSFAALIVALVALFKGVG